MAQGSFARRRVTAVLVGVIFSSLSFGLAIAGSSGECLKVVPPQVTARGAEGCRIQAAVVNICPNARQMAIVRAVPHPQRGPIPPATQKVDRFQLLPLAFEREICDQNIRFIELDGIPGDVTDNAFTPTISLVQAEARAGEVNACVAHCPAARDPDAIWRELRDRYGRAVDDPEGEAAARTLWGVARSREWRLESICAATCQGRLDHVQIVELGGRLQEADESARAAQALATLNAIAARPPRAAAPDPSLVPAMDASERRPPGRERAARAGRGGHAQATVCQRGASGRQRCTIAIDTRREAGRAEAQREAGRSLRQGQRVRAEQRREPLTRASITAGGPQ